MVPYLNKPCNPQSDLTWALFGHDTPEGSGDVMNAKIWDSAIKLEASRILVALRPIATSQTLIVALRVLELITEDVCLSTL